MKIRIYLALQEMVDGRVQFRRWSPDMPGVPAGGLNEKQTKEAHLWIQRMVWVCAKNDIKPMVMWEEPMSVLDSFFKMVRPFDIVEAETEETLFVEELRQAGFEDARFVG